MMNVVSILPRIAMIALAVATARAQLTPSSSGVDPTAPLVTSAGPTPTPTAVPASESRIATPAPTASTISVPIPPPTVPPTPSTPTTPPPAPTPPSTTIASDGSDCSFGGILASLVGNDQALIDGLVAQLELRLPPGADRTIPATVTLTPDRALALDATTLSFNREGDPDKHIVQAKFNAASGLLNGDLISLGINWNYPSQPNCQQLANTLKLLLDKRDSTSGHAKGDPHFLTIDGATFDFMPPGIFKFVETSNMLIHGAIHRCAKVGCIYGVAIQVNKSIIRLVAEGNDLSLTKGTSTISDFRVMKPKRGRGYRIFLVSDPSTYIEVYMGNFAGVSVFDVSVHLSTFMRNNNVNGMLGNANGNKNDDIRDSTTLNRLYRLTGANLFTCIDCSTLMKSALPSDCIKMEPVPVLCQGGYTVVNESTIVQRVPMMENRRRLRAADPGVPNVPSCQFNVTTVDALCGQVRQIPACDQYIENVDFYVESCRADTLLLMDQQQVDHAKLDYLRECRRQLDAAIALKADTTPDSKQQAQDDRSSLTLANPSTCPGNCSGRGTCLMNGCDCNPGYTGLECEIKFDLCLPSTTPKSNSAVRL